MTARTVLGSFIVLFVLAQAGFAGTQNLLQNYFSDAAQQVKAVENPVAKRDILNHKLQSMSRASDMVLAAPYLSKNDRDGILRFKALLQAKQDELMGRNGYTKVMDKDLNVFADYIVQDMEQADATITISIVSLLVIIILVILIAR